MAATNMPELGTGYPEPFKAPAFGLFARHVKDLELQNIRFSFAEEDHRPAMICNDVEGLEIDDFKSQVAEKVPVAKFHIGQRPRHPQLPLIEESKERMKQGRIRHLQTILSLIEFCHLEPK